MKISVWLVFAVYCLLASAAWIATPVPDGGRFFERQAGLFAVVGLGAAVFAGKDLWAPARRLPWARLAIAGVGFWGVPVCLIRWAGSGVPSIVISAAFALLPAVVVLVVSSIGGVEDNGEGWGFLAPALAAFGGVLLMLPVGLPESVRGQLMLGVAFAAVLLVAVSGVWVHQLMQGGALRVTIAIVCFANAVFLMISGLATGDFVGRWNGWAGILSLSFGVDLIQMILAFWLLREMPPVRFATRYLVIPLLTVVEGYVVLRPEVTARMGTGAVLVAGGAVWILFSKKSDDGGILSLR
jgi:drug/metabolite transporter (DMT)-like permease